MSEFGKEILLITLSHISICEERFADIKTAEDFINSKDGNMKLDAIAMRLQAIGENISKLSKLYPALHKKYLEINWNDIVRFRDFISHHYELLDYEIVYNICAVHLPLLKLALQKELNS